MDLNGGFWNTKALCSPLPMNLFLGTSDFIMMVSCNPEESCLCVDLKSPCHCLVETVNPSLCCLHSHKLTPVSFFFTSISIGKPFKLSNSAEEVATFFAKMLDHEYTTKDAFRKNFFKDWRKVLAFKVMVRGVKTGCS